jgi:hypothetical protein
VGGQTMDAIRVEWCLGARSFQRKKRRHSGGQTKAEDLEKFVMTSSFAGELLVGTFANSEKSQWIYY